MAYYVNDVATTIARRGNIYEFIDNNPSCHDSNYPKFALIISSDNRCQDNIVSSIMLSSTFAGTDAIEVGDFEGFGKLYAKCGKVTFCRRAQLGEYIKTLNNHTMRKVDECIIDNLGLSEVVADVPVKHIENTEAVEEPKVISVVDDSTLQEYKFKAQFYEKQYNDLLERMLGGK